jgi:hypothetical protein
METRKRKRHSQAGQKNSSVQAFSVCKFFATFPNDEACLIRVMEVHYGLRHLCGHCGKDATFHKIDKRRAYACAACGDHVYPWPGQSSKAVRRRCRHGFMRSIYLSRLVKV